MAASIADLRYQFYGGGIDAEKAYMVGNAAISMPDAHKGYFGASIAQPPTKNIADLRRTFWGGGVDAEYAALSTSYAEHFTGSSLGAGWSSAHSLWPTQFNAPIVGGGYLSCDSPAVDSFDTGPWSDGVTTCWNVGHMAIGRAAGFTDNAEVTITYVVTQTLEGLMQVGPMSHGDFSAVTVTEMGVNPFYDISIGAAYTQNVFRTPTLAGVKDHTYYIALTGSNANWPTAPTPGRHTWIMRCVGGFVRCWHDGVPLGVKAARSAWSNGRDFWGVHVVSITLMNGRALPGAPAIIGTGTDRCHIESFQVRPYTQPLL